MHLFLKDPLADDHGGLPILSIVQALLNREFWACLQSLIFRASCCIGHWCDQHASVISSNVDATLYSMNQRHY